MNVKLLPDVECYPYTELTSLAILMSVSSLLFYIIIFVLIKLPVNIFNHPSDHVFAWLKTNRIESCGSKVLVGHVACDGESLFHTGAHEQRRDVHVALIVKTMMTTIATMVSCHHHQGLVEYSSARESFENISNVAINFLHNNIIEEQQLRTCYWLISVQLISFSFLP